MADLATNLLIIVTLVVLEAVLSFDNAAILAVMSRRLPAGKARSRALNYGLGIAYVLRFLAILGAVFLIQNPLFLTAGGAYLMFLFVRHTVRAIRHRAAPHRARDAAPRGFWGLTPFQVLVLQIGFIDLAFALDQVIAAVAFTKDNEFQLLLIWAAASLGLVALRALAPLLSRLMDWLPTLEHIAYVAVGFVGALLILEDLPFVETSPDPHFVLLHFQLHPDPAVAKTIKIAVTLALFLVPVLVKYFFGIPRSRTTDSAVTKAIDKAHDDSKKP